MRLKNVRFIVELIQSSCTKIISIKEQFWFSHDFGTPSSVHSRKKISVSFNCQMEHWPKVTLSVVFIWGRKKEKEGERERERERGGEGERCRRWWWWKRICVCVWACVFLFEKCFFFFFWKRGGGGGGGRTVTVEKRSRQKVVCCKRVKETERETQTKNHARTRS